MDEEFIEDYPRFRRYAKLGVPAKPIVYGKTPPSTDLRSIKSVNVRGREEHEKILNDPEKMRDLGLDPVYERLVYLQRWGCFLCDDN